MINSMETYEIALQATGNGAGRMYRILLLKGDDPNAASFINEFIGNIKTGGYFMVNDLRAGQSIDVPQSVGEFPVRPSQVSTGYVNKVIPPEHEIVTGGIMPDPTPTDYLVKR